MSHFLAPPLVETIPHTKPVLLAFSADNVKEVVLQMEKTFISSSVFGKLIWDHAFSHYQSPTLTQMSVCVLVWRYKDNTAQEVAILGFKFLTNNARTLIPGQWLSPAFPADHQRVKRILNEQESEGLRKAATLPLPPRGSTEQIRSLQKAATNPQSMAAPLQLRPPERVSQIIFQGSHNAASFYTALHGLFQTGSLDTNWLDAYVTKTSESRSNGRLSEYEFAVWHAEHLPIACICADIRFNRRHQVGNESPISARIDLFELNLQYAAKQRDYIDGLLDIVTKTRISSILIVLHKMAIEPETAFQARLAELQWYLAGKNLFSGQFQIAPLTGNDISKSIWNLHEHRETAGWYIKRVLPSVRTS